MISIPVSMILVAVGKTVGGFEGICHTNLEYKHLNQHGFFEKKTTLEEACCRGGRDEAG